MPPTPARVHAWIRQNIHIEGRPDWIFVKVYTHGAPEAQAAALLGAGGRVMHETLSGSLQRRRPLEASLRDGTGDVQRRQGRNGGEER